MATYSDTQKASALAYLDACKGNVAKAARDCKIPRATLTNWARGRHVVPEVSEICQEKKGALADRLENLADLIIDALPEKIGDASLKDSATSIGILVDKMQLLRNKPTVITDDLSGLSDDELDRRIAAAEAGETAAADAIETFGGTAAVQ